ncbi:hypothetical protein AL542_12300 [Grimontia hollisae]|nr:hypothetical protein AL542_12300 [Grimontia hollisae]
MALPNFFKDSGTGKRAFLTGSQSITTSVDSVKKIYKQEKYIKGVLYTYGHTFLIQTPSLEKLVADASCRPACYWPSQFDQLILWIALIVFI